MTLSPSPLALALRLDPWAAEYGPETPLDQAEAAAGDAADLSVEVAVADWSPRTPGKDATPPRRLVFVDGVRRVEARVVAVSGETLIPGAFSSYAVGSVILEDGAARWGEARCERVLALAGGTSVPGGIEVAPGLVYRPVSSADPDPDAPVRRLQEEMRLAEAALAREQAEAEATLVIADGPLRFGDARGAAAGYVKRLFRRYGVPLAALAALTPGTRTPLLAISGRGFARYSWFLRLAPRGRADFDLAGIVRLELPDSVGLEQAQRLADGTARALPRLAPTRSRDPRAPQNLLPIGALESRLRRLMGDPLLARRRIESYLAGAEPAHG